MAEISCVDVFSEDVTEFLRNTLCHQQDQKEWSSWSEWLATPPLWTVLRVNSHRITKAEAKVRLESFLAEHAKVNSACAGLSVVEHPHLDDALVVASPKTSPAPEPATKQVIVGLQCGVAVLRGADVFAPGVLAMDTAVQKGDTVSVYADVNGLCRRGLTKPFDGAVQYVGNGRADISRYALFHTEQPSGVAITMTQPLFTAPPLSGLHADALFPQNLPSIVACHVLAPRPGETVLDMCAAPGGKTTHIASLMNDTGVVVALDKSAARLKRVEENCQRLGITCVRSYACDARKSVARPTAESPTASATLQSPPFPPESFDRILLDGPCSALGQRPQIRNSIPLKELQSFPPYQRQIFERAVELLRPGGVLVYCTCTVTLDENEGAVAWALAKFPCLRLAKQEPHLGGTGFTVDGLDSAQAELVQRFSPSPAGSPCRHHPESNSTEAAAASLSSASSSDNAGCHSNAASVNNDTIGFFIAKFTKEL
ncbi:tRNA (cytosine(72)-C(5))-methyltransferase NSUN6-like isoform X2 [Sycon ciliatum]|uniref:tRNA (cytosine(72)-C(5))-methyltransferase NSUN6-like isoform X2 n=1 Tax=Sycon ciliatum TaxID=27933 RepID=UPI0020AED7E1